MDNTNSLFVILRAKLLLFICAVEFPNCLHLLPLLLDSSSSSDATALIVGSVIVERKGVSVGSAPGGTTAAVAPGSGAGTPTKKRAGSHGKKDVSKPAHGSGSQSASHSVVVSPSPPPSATAGSVSPQPSAGDRAAETSTAGASSAPVAPGEDQRDYRVAVFGAGGVGKSALVQRFIKNMFSDTYVPTIEDTYQQVITCSEHNQRLAVCTLHLIDTTGSHQFPAMQRLAMQRGQAFILVYSVTSRQSLEELGPIVRTLREVKGDAAIADVPVLLVGNKIDEQRREVAHDTGEALAQRWGCGFVETSAKNGLHVTELFQKLLSLEKRRHLSLNAPESESERASNGPKHRKCTIL